MTITETPMIIDEETLTEVAASIWEIMFELPIEPEPTASVAFGPSASISICGAWTATLIITMDDGLAADTAAALLMMDADELETPDLHDALGEIANIAGGNLKGLFDHDTDLKLSLPVVSTSELNAKSSVDSVCARFTVSGQSMVWELHSVAAD
ncbi:MAG: chemotaxis protein CheX [Ilumatobacter sp.]